MSTPATVPSILLPEKRVVSAAAPAPRHLRAVPRWSPPAGAAGPAVPSASLSSRVSSAPLRSYAPPVQKNRRPLATGGAPPTVIRDLDALFAADRRRRSAPPAPAPTLPASEPMDPKDLARALLHKVQRDFGVVAPPAPAPVARFVVTEPTQRDEPTHALALPDDDEDVRRLTPWYTRLFRALFG